MKSPEGLEYDVTGSGEPVLLIPGGAIANSFAPMAAEPALSGYSLIRYNRRGYAGSDRHAGPFGIPNQAKDALAFLRHLGVEKAHVVGHSYGGATGLQLALDAPSAVHSLSLLEPPLVAVPSGQAFVEAMGPAVESYAAGNTADAIDKFLTLVMNGASWREETESRLPGGPAQTERDAATLFEVELPALGEWKFDAETAKRITQPVLYVLGSESGMFFEEGSRLAQEWMPQTEVFLMPGSNHALQMHEPKLAAEGVAAFLARHPLN